MQGNGDQEGILDSGEIQNTSNKGTENLDFEGLNSENLRLVFGKIEDQFQGASNGNDLLSRYFAGNNFGSIVFKLFSILGTIFECFKLTGFQ